ncbi:MAG: condensation domain-containing protein, partial [Tabrizicola sp.]|nr:condensation domain-containing protein [Tabrizicola sp.]
MNAPSQPGSGTQTSPYLRSMAKVAIEYDAMGGKLPYRNLSISMMLRGALDVSALTIGLQEIVRRQECFRMHFQLDGNEILSLVEEWKETAIEVIDLTHEPPSASLASARADTLRRREIPFTPSAGPLYRFILYKVEGGVYLFSAIVDHLIFDGWSLGIFLEKLSEYYNSALAGVVLHSKDTSLQYSDAALWSSQRLFNGEMSSDLAYWRTQLNGVTS